MVKKRFRIFLWKKLNNNTNIFNDIPDNKIDQLFTLCVNYLHFLSNRLDMTYNEINIWIFCIIWPLITLVLLILAII